MNMPNERTVAEMVIQLGRAGFCEGPGGLTPAQWTALRYFSRANRFSRTVSAFAGFHATTKGTASQTVKSLVGRQLLTRTPSERDGRSVTLDLTSAGEALLAQDPFQSLVHAVARLPREQRRDVAAGLAQVLEDLARESGRRRFGACKDCFYLCGAFVLGQPAVFTCRLVGEPLDRNETGQICVNFRAEAHENGVEKPTAEAESADPQL